VNWISLNVVQALWWRNVVGKSANWCGMTSHVIILPLSEKTDNEVASELSGKDLGEEVDVRDESGLKNDWDVGGVEKFDGVWLSETSHLLAAQREFDSEALEVDNDEHDNYSGDQVAKVWSVLSVECLFDTVELVWLSQEEMEESDDGTFELSSLIGSDGNWGE